MGIDARRLLVYVALHKNCMIRSDRRCAHAQTWYIQGVNRRYNKGVALSLKHSQKENGLGTIEKQGLQQLQKRKRKMPEK